MMLQKYEVAGIFAVVAVMATALWLLRLDEVNKVVSNVADDAGGTAAVYVAGSRGDNSLRNALVESQDATGGQTSLVINDVKVGDGEAAREGDTLTVHYIGSFTDGTQFDNSKDRGAPFSFTLGKGRVIAGWEEGLIGMREGGTRVLVIPSDMAYGKRGAGPIPPNTPLVFAIELLSISQ